MAGAAATLGLVLRKSVKLGYKIYHNSCSLQRFNLLKSESFSAAQAKLLHTTKSSYGLMEFFDEEKNWGADSVRVGRAWNKEELRIKSNSDLHKLWYVLIKERNMLMTMEHECKEEYERFPNDERLDKVKVSMHNLEEVVIERNKAFHELETGETGIRPAKQVTNQLGLTHFYRYGEHVLPKFVNKKWRQTHIFRDNYQETKVFLSMLEEKKRRMETFSLRCKKRHILGLMRRFPNLDLEAVKEKFPDIDVDKLYQSDQARSHYVSSS